MEGMSLAEELDIRRVGSTKERDMEEVNVFSPLGCLDELGIAANSRLWLN